MSSAGRGGRERDPGIDAMAARWRDAAAALTPVIGTLGFDALFERSVSLVSRRHAWLAAVAAVPAGERLPHLERALAARDSASAAAAQAALQRTFAQMLAHLIGRPLTLRLLRGWRQTLPETSVPPARGD